MSVIGYFTTSPVVLMRRWEPSGGTTTTTTTIGGTTTTTTTIDCNQVYEIDVYAGSNRGDCPLCSGCGFVSDCGECDPLKLEYSTDGGSTWNPAFINFDSVVNCAYLGTFNIGVCETSLIFRIFSVNICSGPIYFKYAANSSTCPSASACGDCTDSETINVMPTGNTSIAFTICTECIRDCCSACCV